MSDQTLRKLCFAKRAGDSLDWIAESLFLAAFFLFCFKLFWSLVGNFTTTALHEILDWSLLFSILGLLLIAFTVSTAAYFVFGEEERPGWLIVAKLRHHPAVEPWLGLLRSAVAVVASFAFLKLIWLTGENGAATIAWWPLLGELFTTF